MCVNEIPQSSQERMAQQIYTKVRPCVVQKKAVKPASQKLIIMLNVKDYEHVWLVWKVL